MKQWETIRIGKKIIAPEKPCFIIAEAGVNHNGNLSLAKKLIDEAKKIGADAIKFQTFKTENLVTRKAKMATYQQNNTGKIEGQFEMLKKIELSYKDFIKLKEYCDKKNILFLSAPLDGESADFLYPLVPAYKIASGDLTNIPFLKTVARKKKPIILSTGMGTLEEVKKAVSTIEKQGNRKIIILHCTTNYPCPLAEVNLRAMETLKKTFPYPVGYSDHTVGTLIPAVAAGRGATLIEKHFTLNKNMRGPDHKASLDPKEFTQMVNAIRDVEESLGSGIKKPTASEKNIAKVARKSMVAKIAIPKGTRITYALLAVKRPGTGISPAQISRIIGKRATRNIRKDTVLKQSMFT